MKKAALISFITSLTIVFGAYSQDVMTMKNGDEIQVKVIDIQPDLVKYKKWDNLDGPSYSEYKTNIFMIKYKNGSKDVFKQSSQPIATSPTSNEDIKKDQAVIMLENTYKKMFENDPSKAYKLISFKKTNGVMRNVFGQSVYQIYFEMTLQIMRDGYKTGNGAVGYWSDFSLPSVKPDLYALGQQFMYTVKFIPRGTVIIFNGDAMMENSDNGFVLKEKKITSTRDLGIQNISNSSEITTSETSKSENLKYNIPNVDVTKYKVFLTSNERNYLIKINQLDVINSSINIAYVQDQVVKNFGNFKILNQNSSQILDSLGLVGKITFSSRNYSTTIQPSFFTDCIFEATLINLKTKEIAFTNTYKLTNFGVLAKAFPSQKDAEDSFIYKQLNPTLIKFFIGNFPLTGKISEIKEKNKKQDEAKLVVVNIGSNHGIQEGYELSLSESTTPTKADLVVTEKFPDYSICKVKNNGKKINDDFATGHTLKVKTIYGPKD